MIIIMKTEVCGIFIKIGPKNNFVENSEIGLDSGTLTVVIPGGKDS